MSTNIEELLHRSRERAEQLRQAGPPCLRYPNERKSVIAVHARDAQDGTRRERFVMLWKGAL